MAAMHASMVVTHSVQIIEEVWRHQVRWSSALFPPRLEGVLMAVVGVHHVGRHVQAAQGEVHQRGQLVPAVAHLSEALQVEYQDVWKRPQAHFYHALLQLLTMRALPCVVWGQLERNKK